MKTEISTYEQQAIDFLNATSTAITVKFKSYGKHFVDDKQSRFIFRVKLANKLGSYSFDFGQSIADGAKEPDAYDILSCLTKYDPESFEDFCSNYGYEAFNDNYTGRNKASYKIYLSVCKEWEGVSKLFSEEQIEVLSEIN